jgi:aspartyl-tRNA(Asn)/glutamyl-tRNA(Gln) amidotransferase subunit A
VDSNFRFRAAGLR